MPSNHLAAPSRRSLLVWLGLLASAGLARADQVSVRGQEPLSGDVTEQEGTLRVRTPGGWTVSVPRDRVLARTRPDGRVELPAADLLEDQGLLHESRGRHLQALDCYASAIDRVLDGL